MKTAEIKLDTLYAIGEGEYRSRQRGIVLALEPHRMVTSGFGRTTTTLLPDPTGRGYSSNYGRRRGLPVVRTAAEFYNRNKPEVTDEELRALAQKLVTEGFCGESLTEDQLSFLDRRAWLTVVRPQAIEVPWVDYQERQRREREARQAEVDRQDRVRRYALANRERVTGLLDELNIHITLPHTEGSSGQSMVGPMYWVDLANLLESVAQAARDDQAAQQLAGVEPRD